METNEEDKRWFYVIVKEVTYIYIYIMQGGRNGGGATTRTRLIYYNCYLPLFLLFFFSSITTLNYHSQSKYVLKR